MRASGASGAGASGTMNMPGFLAAAAELGLNPKQVMEHLGVRSLAGLNLAEALETLRRHLLQDDTSAPPAERGAPAPSIDPPPAALATSPQPYFEEEEDDYTFSLADEDDDPSDEEEQVALAETSVSTAAFGTGRTGAADGPSLPDDDEFDALADVPDFDEFNTPASEPAPAPQRSATRATGPRAVSPTPAPPSGPLSAPEHSRALQRIGQLRGVQPGAPATPYQRNAFKNTVVSQLSETEASTLARGIWGSGSAQLSGDQLDALIRWAKEDDFEEEARLVLEALRAERARAAQSASAAGDMRPSPLRRPSTSRGEPAGGR